MMQASANPLFALRDIVLRPSACFAALSQRPVWGWLAYLLMSLSAIAFWSAYFDHTNLAALQQALAQQLSMPPADAEKWLQRETLLASEVLGDWFGRAAVIFALALWFRLATKQEAPNFGYRHWLAASCFIFLPAVVGDLASYTNMTLSSGFILPAHADLNSLNGLLKLPLASSWSAWAASLPLLLPWYWVLSITVIGTWTPLNHGKAIVVATLPWVAVFASWAIVIALS
ncbi:MULTISPECIES: YIP1 family protein [unclassified Salinivibrio]|uniref:YIP1 family protein n=1 Tax=unclassified Salinivibrio TaxID=2636825 RepID=UPI00351BEC32